MLGIGVNIAITPELPSGKFVQPPSSLREFAPDTLITLPTILAILLKSLAKRHKQLLERGPNELYDDYVHHSCVIGRKVEVWEETGGECDNAKLIASGRVTNILPDLSLRLDTCTEPVQHGRLIFAD